MCSRSLFNACNERETTSYSATRFSIVGSLSMTSAMRVASGSLQSVEVEHASDGPVEGEGTLA
jgi:hypothetical protein